jgi:hypothetical protein
MHTNMTTAIRRHGDARRSGVGSIFTAKAVGALGSAAGSPAGGVLSDDRFRLWSQASSSVLYANTVPAAACSCRWMGSPSLPSHRWTLRTEVCICPAISFQEFRRPCPETLMGTGLDGRVEKAINKTFQAFFADYRHSANWGQSEWRGRHLAPTASWHNLSLL